MDIIKRIMAWWNGVPFIIEYWWPVWQAMEDNRDYMGFESLLLSTDHKVGDVVDVLHDYKLKVHRYKIIRKYKSKGSDHILIPINFDLKYHSTYKVDPNNYEGEIGEVFDPPLLKVK